MHTHNPVMVMDMLKYEMYVEFETDRLRNNRLYILNIYRLITVTSLFVYRSVYPPVTGDSTIQSDRGRAGFDSLTRSLLFAFFLNIMGLTGLLSHRN
jgi:hypothetical protein